MVRGHTCAQNDVYHGGALRTDTAPTKAFPVVVLAGIGAAYGVLGAETSLLWLLERGHVVPPTGRLDLPIYVAAGGAAGLLIGPGGLRALLAMTVFYVGERAIRFALQLRAFTMTRDPSVLDLFLAETALLIAGTLATAAVARGLQARPPRGVLASAGLCFAASVVPLVPLRASAMEVAPSAASSEPLVLALVVVPSVAGAVLARLWRLSTISVMLGALVVILTTATLAIVELTSRAIDRFSLVGSAPLLCAGSLGIASLVIRLPRVLPFLEKRDRQRR